MSTTKCFVSLSLIAIAVFTQAGCGSRQSSAETKKEQAPAKPVCASPPNSQEGVNRLVSAAETGDTAALKTELDCGANVNGVGAPSSATALMLACQQGHDQVVRMLLDRGADASLGQGGSTPLMSAALWGYTDVVGVLLDKGAPVDAKDAHGKTALYYASLAGNDDTATLLIGHGADKKQRTKLSTNDFMRGTIADVDVPNKKIKVLISHALMLAEKGAEVPLDASKARYFGIKGIDELKRGDTVLVHYEMKMTIGGFNFASGQGSAGASYEMQQLAVSHAPVP